MDKVIVTGVLQLSGFHLCVRLLNEGINVVGIDTLDKNKKYKEEMLLSIGRNANFEYVESLDDVKDFCGVDLFFHLCGELMNDSELNKIITLCDKYQIPIIYISSLDVYGRGESCCYEDTMLRPVTPLGKRKKHEEMMLLSNSEEKKRKLVIFRTPYIYGPWQHQGHCMHKLIYMHVKKNIGLDKLLSNETFANQYMYVEDLIEAIMLVINRGFQCEIFNLSVNEQMFSSMKAREHLSFQPKITLQEGIEKQKQHIIKMLKVDPLFFEYKG